jgi:hypothetical protein
MRAGGPYTLSVAARGKSARAEDILIGDVWLCSGQSNMEYPVAGVLGAAGEIGKANDPELRLMTVEKKTSLSPERQFPAPGRSGSGPRPRRCAISPPPAISWPAICAPRRKCRWG